MTTTIANPPKERGILFSAPMVRACLDGSKTQTRRIMKPQPGGPAFGFPVPHVTPSGVTWFDEDKQFNTKQVCPYGQPGDNLWVRETWAWLCDDPIPPYRDHDHRFITWRATYQECASDRIPWKPSIHMPRWGSRLSLEITEVRVERLQDISERDAQEEGISTWLETNPREHWDGDPDEARKCYRDLWEQINGEGSWALNPFVWVVSFKVAGAAGLLNTQGATE